MVYPFLGNKVVVVLAALAVHYLMMAHLMAVVADVISHLQVQPQVMAMALVVQ
jgi:hypothetical protein